MDFAIPFGDQQMPLTCTLGMDLDDQAYSVLTKLSHVILILIAGNLLPICPVKTYIMEMDGTGSFFVCRSRKCPVESPSSFPQRSSKEGLQRPDGSPGVS